jgi:hypothetical protein
LLSEKSRIQSYKIGYKEEGRRRMKNEEEWRRRMVGFIKTYDTREGHITD